MKGLAVETDERVIWFEDPSEGEEESQVESYDITASPNDFNISTIFNFLDKGTIKIPNFQRNYVWDIKRASKLIESILLGLPVPQVFLYQEEINSFLVIDGQQRLMSIYYFMKQRFPKASKRVDLRRIFDEHGNIPPEVLQDDEYFTKFNLSLASFADGRKNKYSKLNYETLADYKTQFDLRVVRNIIVKQNAPEDGDSSIFEIFNRLNTGGVNLTPQEIRTSLYHCDFFNMLNRLNRNEDWRALLKLSEPDLHMKDAEILLRSIAFLMTRDSYRPSLTKFINVFSKKAKASMPESRVEDLEGIVEKFLTACRTLPEGIFYNSNGKFNILLFEAVFCAYCTPVLSDLSKAITVDATKISTLKVDDRFVAACQEGTTKTDKTATRFDRAISLLGG